MNSSLIVAVMLGICMGFIMVEYSQWRFRRMLRKTLSSFIDRFMNDPSYRDRVREAISIVIRFGLESFREEFMRGIRETIAGDIGARVVGTNPTSNTNPNSNNSINNNSE